MNKLFLILTFALCCSCASSPGAADNPTIVNPDCDHQVYRHVPNGWLLNQAVMSFVFWGSYWNTASGEYNNYYDIWNTLIQNGQTFDRIAEYGIGQPILNSNLYLNNPAATTPLSDGGAGFVSQNSSFSVIDANGISLEIANEIQAGSLPTPQSETLYVIFLPPNVFTSNMVNTDGSRNGVVGYHSSATFDGTNYAYAVITYYQNQNDNDWVVNHEMMEAMTNPDCGSGYWDNATGDEIADLCDGMVEVIDGYNVQKVWSQALCTCI